MNPTRIYHITHINNLPSIIQHNGLYSDNLSNERGLQPRSIAHHHIKERRARRLVPYAAGGTLADYVPFYFAPRSPMLFAIHRGQVPVYNKGQRDIIHLVSTVEAVLQSGVPFAFTDGHADIAYSQFFDNLDALAQHVDWSLMRERYWNNTAQDGDRKRRRQAEFLIYQHVPWALIQQIGVIDRQRQQQVEALIAQLAHCPQVLIQRNWYY
jgi:hypothetical protein